MDNAGIVNLALQKLGTRTTVTAAELVAQSTNEAIQANLAITQTRDELLRLAPWQCSKGMIDLQYITSSPGTPENQSVPPSQTQWTPGLPLPPWSYEYGYPQDCLRALSIVPQAATGVSGVPIYPTNTSTGYAAIGQGPPIKFDVGNEILWQAGGATVASGGTGYVVGDFIYLGYGPNTLPPIGLPAILQVVGISLGGVATSVNVVQTIAGEPTATHSGGYFNINIGPQAQASTNGNGTGGIFNLTTWSQNQQRVILTNQEFAVLNYVRQVIDPNIMDPLFVKAWYHAMGANLAMSLTGDKSLANGLIQITNACIAEARATDGNEALTVMDTTPDWLRCRGWASSGAWNTGTGYSWDAIGMWSGY